MTNDLPGRLGISRSDYREIETGKRCTAPLLRELVRELHVWAAETFARRSAAE